MNRIFLVCLFCFCLVIPVLGQDSTQTGISRSSEPNRPLNSLELARQKTFYSIDEAMREPENVYILSLQGQKLKDFPGALIVMKNLQVLNLSENNIRSIPATISELPNLQVLNLSGNKIRYLPDEMAELNHLEQLYLGGNRLVSMPAWVGGLSKMRALDLSYNNLTTYEIELVRFRLPNCNVTH